MDLVSASAVSELTDRLWEDYEAFTKRDLSDFAVEFCERSSKIGGWRFSMSILRLD
jgi:hypothetical protein